MNFYSYTFKNVQPLRMLKFLFYHFLVEFKLVFHFNLLISA
jgi:hypothetical protein